MWGAVVVGGGCRKQREKARRCRNTMSSTSSSRTGDFTSALMRSEIERFANSFFMCIYVGCRWPFKPRKADVHGCRHRVAVPIFVTVRRLFTLEHVYRTTCWFRIQCFSQSLGCVPAVGVLFLPPTTLAGCVLECVLK